MKYLIQSRLLTVTKEFVYDPARYDARDYEGLKTVPGRLRKVMKMSVDDTVLKRIVSLIQSTMSLSCIQLMRAELEKLTTEKEGRLS